MNTTDQRTDGSPDPIPVIEEHIDYEVRQHKTGKVRIAKRVKEEVVDVEETLIQEHVHVERVPMNQFVDTLPPPMRQENDVTIVPVLKEVMVKRVLLVEELHIRKTKETKQDTQQVTLRKEEVQIHRDQ